LLAERAAEVPTLQSTSFHKEVKLYVLDNSTWMDWRTFCYIARGSKTWSSCVNDEEDYVHSPVNDVIKEVDVEETPGASPDACDDNWVQTERWAAIVLENVHKEIATWYGSTIVACWYVKIQKHYD
jgi:hypothetical protein